MGRNASPGSTTGQIDGDGGRGRNASTFLARAGGNGGEEDHCDPR